MSKHPYHEHDFIWFASPNFFFLCHRCRFRHFHSIFLFFFSCVHCTFHDNSTTNLSRANFNVLFSAFFTFYISNESKICTQLQNEWNERISLVFFSIFFLFFLTNSKDNINKWYVKRNGKKWFGMSFCYLISFFFGWMPHHLEKINHISTVSST